MWLSVIVLTAALLRSTVVMGANVINAPSTPSAGAFGSSCTTGNGVKGVCVPNYLCNPDTNTIDNNALIELRVGSCPHFLQICCLNEELNVKPNEPEEVPSCGWSNPGAVAIRSKDEKVTTAEFGEFPWMVALLKNNAPDVEWSQKDYLGGGSIIHPSVVITAAHKVDGLDANQVKCRAGEWDTADDSEQYASEERYVKSIVTHDEFFRLQVYHNVALLFLEKPFTFRNPHIGLGCLGKKLPEPGTQCYSTGWGKDFKGEYATTLKKITLPVIDSEICQRKLRNTRLGSRFRLHPSLFCAGGETGIDSCKGDGGSPLVCAIEDPKQGTRYAIFGIVSSGIGCGKNNVPAVYVNVPYIYDWVLKTMDEEKLNATSFTY